MDRPLNEIEADIARAQSEHDANYAAWKEMLKTIDGMKAELDRRVQETFAAEFAAIAEAEARRKQQQRDTKPAKDRLEALWQERKVAQLVPGAAVIWDEPNGWNSKLGRRATVTGRSEKRVRIDLGEGRHDRFKLVTFDAVRLLAEKEAARG